MATATDFTGIEKIVLFHGTSKELLAAILESGLLPWGQTGKHNWQADYDMFGFFTPNKDCVYFASLEKARHHADRIDGTGIIIEAELDISNLVPDEDSRQKTWQESLAKHSTCAHKNAVPAERIKRIYDL
ncbi:hypothetical protein KY311_00060, partial [Candidatus Woesearchaeota archaeon]|nr:hypothetical protein [Candidatus Woesearchaeota archaeon]